MRTKLLLETASEPLHVGSREVDRGARSHGAEVHHRLADGLMVVVEDLDPPLGNSHAHEDLPEIRVAVVDSTRADDVIAGRQHCVDDPFHILGRPAVVRVTTIGEDDGHAPRRLALLS